MNKYLNFALVFFMSITWGCKTIHQEGPVVTTAPVKMKLQDKKNGIRNHASSASNIPSVLGGIVASDRWIVYKDKQQEEFIGHVAFDNGVYSFKADYALSERIFNKISAKGHIYAKQIASDGNIYEAYADAATYNYKTEKGILKSNKLNNVKITYTNANKVQKVVATAKKVSIDMKNRIFILEKDVTVTRESVDGNQKITAQKATLKQLNDYLILEGEATLSDELRTLEANTIIYDGSNNFSKAYGNRPLLHGTSEQGTFAIIADEVLSDSEGQKFELNGKVQGWFVSPQINQSSINNKF